MSRLFGLFTANGKDFHIRQEQHYLPGGEYEIQDCDKRAEYEAEKAKEQKGS